MTLADLKERLDAAGGADRELDLALALIHFPDTTDATWLTDELERVAFGSQQPYTSSLDAALGLVEATLPGCDWRVELDREQPSPPYSAWVDPNDGLSGPLCEQGSSPSLALLSALLSALMAEEVKPPSPRP